MNNPYDARKLVEERASGVKRYFWIYVIARLPLFLFWLVWDPLAAWSDSRDDLGKKLLLGLPALLAFLAASVFAYYLVIKREKDLDWAYLQIADRASYFKNYDAASIYFRRLIQRGERDPEVIFIAALNTGEAGHEEEKEALLAQLTHGANRHGPAHLYKARVYLAEPDGTKTSLAKQEVEKALEADPGLTEAHALLGHLLMEEGDTVQAITHFEQAFTSLPEVALSLASLHEQEGSEKETVRWARQAEKVFADQEAMAEKESAEQRFAIIRRAQALALAKRYPNALSKLRLVYHDGQDAEVRAASAGVYAQWSRALFMYQEDEETGQARVAQAVQLLGRAAELSLAEPTTISVLAELTGLKETSLSVSDDVLEVLLAKGETPWLLHWIAGVRAWNQDLAEAERAHLGFAHELNPMAPMLLAHLVFRACSQEHLDVEEGFRLLSAADGLDKTSHASLAIAEVRGALLSQNQRWAEAIAAYKVALSINDDRPNLHLALAKAYEGTNNAMEALAHRGKAEALKAKRESE